jgi:hypothetical protein
LGLIALHKDPKSDCGYVTPGVRMHAMGVDTWAPGLIALLCGMI